jgi:hypothetical protein
MSPCPRGIVEPVLAGYSLTTTTLSAAVCILILAVILFRAARLGHLGVHGLAVPAMIGAAALVTVASAPQDPAPVRGDLAGYAIGEDGGPAAPNDDQRPMPKGPLQGRDNPIHDVAVTGSPAFRAAITRAFAQFRDHASPEMLDIVSRARTVTELRRSGQSSNGVTFAYTRWPGCNISVYSEGWRGGKRWLVQVLAHEALHCWLFDHGRHSESERHGPIFKQTEVRAAAEIFGRGRRHAGAYEEE